MSDQPRWTGAFVGEPGPTRLTEQGGFPEMPEPWPLAVGDIVEDHRPKKVFDPDPNDTYGGSPGKVIDVDSGGFKVEWEDGGHTGVRYAWPWLGYGINKREVLRG